MSVKADPRHPQASKPSVPSPSLYDGHAGHRTSITPSRSGVPRLRLPPMDHHTVTLAEYRAWDAEQS